MQTPDIITPGEALEALASARGYEVRTPAWIGDEPAECVEIFKKGARTRSLAVLCFTDGRLLPFQVQDDTYGLRAFARAVQVLEEAARLKI